MLGRFIAEAVITSHDEFARRYPDHHGPVFLIYFLGRSLHGNGQRDHCDNLHQLWIS
jgi:hypothetical protein